MTEARRPADWREEGHDLATLAVAGVVVVGTWLALGWRPGLWIAGGDALIHTRWLFDELAAQAGDWTRVHYRASLLGGVKLHDAVGTSPLFQGLAALRLSAAAMVDVSVLTLQTLFAFLATRSSESLAQLWRDDPAPVRASLPARIGLAWIFGFLPLLAWRWGHGHLILIVGVFAYVGGLALLLAARAGRVSRVLFAAALVAVAFALPAQGAQLVVYGLVFGAPVGLALLWPSGVGTPPLRALVPVCLALLAALALSLPKLAPMFAHALGSDAMRTFGGEPVVASYTVASLRDWLASLPWTPELFATGRHDYLLHETNYPLGPLLLVCGLAPWRRAWPLLAGLVVSGALAMAFAARVGPIADALGSAIPLLDGFRIPARAVLPAALTLPIVACAALLHRLPASGRVPVPAWGAAAAFVGAAWWLPAPWGEAVVWIAVAGAVVALLRGWRGVRVGLALAVLGLAGLPAFSARLLPFANARVLADSADALGAALSTGREPEAGPLVRVHLALEHPYGLNLGPAIGVPTLGGYFMPTRRFGALVAALSGRPLEPARVLYPLPPGAPAFRSLQVLYDVCCRVERDAGAVRVVPLPHTAGSAWFPRRVRVVRDLPELATALARRGRRPLADRVRETLWLVADDEAVRRTGLAEDTELPEACANAEVGPLEATLGGQRLEATVETAATCPLVLALNFVETWRARLVSPDGAGVDATVLPADGALTAVVVPPGRHRLVLEATPVVPVAARAGFLLGAGLAFAGLLLAPVIARPRSAA